MTLCRVERRVTLLAVMLNALSRVDTANHSHLFWVNTRCPWPHQKWRLETCRFSKKIGIIGKISHLVRSQGLRGVDQCSTSLLHLSICLAWTWISWIWTIFYSCFKFAAFTKLRGDHCGQYNSAIVTPCQSPDQRISRQNYIKVWGDCNSWDANFREKPCFDTTSR